MQLQPELNRRQMERARFSGRSVAVGAVGVNLFLPLHRGLARFAGKPAHAGYEPFFEFKAVREGAIQRISVDGFGVPPFLMEELRASERECGELSSASPFGSRPRGRPRGFDRDDVLDRAMYLFWERGYEATSVSELTEAMGITPPTLYNFFGT